MAAEKCASPKIRASGWNVTIVPRRLTVPVSFSLPMALPRSKRILWPWRSRATSTSIQSDSAFTHRRAHAVQAAGGVIDLAAELSAGMQRGHDHFQRGLVLVFGMRIDRDAAAVVADGEHVAGRQLDLDAAGMAGHGFVHRIVEDFGRQVMQRVHIRAADIHAGAAADGLQPLQHFDVLGGIALRCGAGGSKRSGSSGFEAMATPELFQTHGRRSGDSW